MVGQFSYKIEGFPEMSRALRALPDRMEKRVIQSALRRGAKVINDAWIAVAPTGTEAKHEEYGHLKDNINIKLQRATRDFARMAVSVGKAFWAAFFEFGTRHQPARPTFRPAFDQSAQPAIVAIIEGMVDGLEREANKLVSDFGTASKAINGRSR